MKLIRAKLWAEKNFEPSSRPTALTISRWIKNGSIHGAIISGGVYVDESNPFPVIAEEVHDNEITDAMKRLIALGYITKEDCINRIRINRGEKV